MSEPTRVAVLGAGRVGAAMALDLAADEALRVRAVDASEDALAELGARAQGRASGSGDSARLSTLAADLSDEEGVARAVEDADLVVGAVPGPMGFDTLRQVVDVGRPVVDISFFEEDPFRLDGLARERGVPAVVDAGLAPGLSNLICGRLLAEWDAMEAFDCMVGGLPVDRSAPFQYRAPFSPLDVLAEYTRPARIRRDGEGRTLPALSEIEEVEFPGVGTLEAFLTDGLRTLLDTTDVPEMTERTLRYPGHAAAMRGLREAGFFSGGTVRVAGTDVRPLDLTGRLLTEAWSMAPDEEDLVAMAVTARGRSDGAPVERRYRLLDRYDPATGTTAMARTTGYTCTACVRALVRDLWTESGIVPLEDLGRNRACFDFIVGELRTRGVRLEEI